MLELATINPSYVIGPLLDEVKPASVEIVGKLLRREVPGCVHLGLSLVDLRDVASAHLSAMTEPQAAGKRFICDAEFYWSQEIAHVLEEHFGQRGYRTPTRMLPNFAMYLVAIFDKKVSGAFFPIWSAGHGIVRAAQEHAELATATCGGGDCG